MTRTLLLSWPIQGTTGWGVNGANLARHASLAGWQVYADGGIDWSTLPPWWRLEGWDVLPHVKGMRYTSALYAAGNGVAPHIEPGLADRFLIETFLEDTAKITPDVVDAYNAAHAVIVGSWWNYTLLRDAGVTNLALIHQGADTAGLMGVPEQERRFIFSGGKLEQRKAQDVVIAAFREYLTVDRDAVLVTAWQNPWLRTVQGIDASGHVRGIPPFRPGTQTLDVAGWCEKNGIPRKNVVDLGVLPSYALQSAIASCHLAIQVSRAEGGVPLPALEALAHGVPVLTVDGTGTADLRGMGADNVECTPFSGKAPLFRGTEGWVEPSVAGLAAAMARGWVRDDELRPPTWQEHAEKVLKLAEG